MTCLLLLPTSQGLRLEVPSSVGRIIFVKFTREDNDPTELALSVTDWRDNEKRNPTDEEILQQYRTHPATTSDQFNLPSDFGAGAVILEAKVNGFVSHTALLSTGAEMSNSFMMVIGFDR